MTPTEKQELFDLLSTKRDAFLKNLTADTKEALVEALWDNKGGIVDALRPRAVRADTPPVVKRETFDRCMETCRLLRSNLAEAQIKLCPKFKECGDKEGDGCTCFPDGGPYANAVPPNTYAVRAGTMPSEERIAHLIRIHVGAWLKEDRLPSILGDIPTAAEQDARDLAKALLALLAQGTDQPTYAIASCYACDGDGIQEGGSPCHQCNGHGKVGVLPPSRSSGEPTYTMPADGESR